MPYGNGIVTPRFGRLGTGRRRVSISVFVVGALAVTVIMSGCKDPGSIQPSPGSSLTSANPRYPSSMAALGDSITLGFGSCLVPTACPRNSWATGNGTLVNSHYKRILAANPAIRGNTHNFAATKATAADLTGQATAAVTAKVEYVTILIGANDACHGTIDSMTSVTAFRSKIDETLSTLAKGLPKARVLVVSLPDIYHLWEIAHTNRAAVKVWSTGICPALLTNPTSTAPVDVTRRAAFRARIDAYDSQLAAACTAHRAQCRYDNGAVHSTAFTLNMIDVVDFFHPNVSGQDAVAKASYPDRFN